MSFNIQNNRSTCQTKDQKTLDLREKDVVDISLQSSSSLDKRQFSTIVSKSFMNGGQFLVSQRELGDDCGITREWSNKTLNLNSLINVRNRGHRAFCAYSPIVNYSLNEIALKAENNSLFREILNNIVGSLYYSKTFIEVTSLLGIKVNDTLARFSDNAYSHAYNKFLNTVSSIENKAAYFYTLCFNYHKKHNIPLIS